MSDTKELIARLRMDNCQCHEGYKCRNKIDPSCVSCETKDERNEAANALEAAAAENARLVEKLAVCERDWERSNLENKKLADQIKAQETATKVVYKCLAITRETRDRLAAELAAIRKQEPVVEVCSIHYAGNPPAALTAQFLCESSEYWKLPIREGAKLYAAPVAQPAQARELSPAEIDAIVYKCRQDGDDSTYSIVRAAIAACKGGK